MKVEIPTDYKSVLEKIEQIDPLKYGKTRNYIDGAVTYLSPYISRGVISTKMVLESVLKREFKLYEIETFVKELCWRDYFQRVGQVKDLNKEIKHLRQDFLNYEIPESIVNGKTGIEGVDRAIHQLYKTGYMHNHCRMYTASITCNIGKSHWLHPAKWMYYHLLDGDWASNACSWQWVAGVNSHKQYYANQENINKFTRTGQTNTFLDEAYEQIKEMEVPTELLSTQKFLPETKWPEIPAVGVDRNKPTFIYNYYNLDPLWHKEEEGNRILLIDPQFFSDFPISEKCVDFMLALSKNIPDIQVFRGSFESLANTYQLEKIYFKEHPLNYGYKGIMEERDWISENISGYFPSFFSYWKKVNKQLSNIS
ncbi:MAG: deoxyribodipyrimidine photolyase [Chitinophagaceae bacterium]|nr:MAG: deoxyribodipyrimidine photolyase [Chitinophagaceae bacterium]